MKPLIKKITGLLLGLALVSAVSIQGATTNRSFGGIGSNFTNILSGACRITSITIDLSADPLNATNMAYRLLDAPFTNHSNFRLLGQHVGAYTTVVQRMQWYTNWSTNFGSGLVYSNAFYAPSNAIETVAATTNYYTIISSGIVASNSVKTITLPDDGYDAKYGLTLTNISPGVGFTVIVTYWPSL